MTSLLRKKLLAAALAGVTGIAGSLTAQDKPRERTPDKKLLRRELHVVTVANTGKHWIGVHATPVTDEALRSQLGLTERLIVMQVLPDSPAAKAGVQRHDILLKFGEKELHTLEDLVQAVDANADKRATLTVLRGGKEATIEVEPAERPKDEVVHSLADVNPENLRVWMKEHSRDGEKSGQYIVRMLGPGIVANNALELVQPASFPDGWSVTVSKQAGQPMKVVAVKDGKTYEATEGKLDSLPENIRPHVARMLSGTPILASSAEPWEFKVRGEFEEEVKQAIETAKRAATAGVGKAARRIEVQGADGALENLQKEVERLRADVEKLKGAESESRAESKDSAK